MSTYRHDPLWSACQKRISPSRHFNSKSTSCSSHTSKLPVLNPEPPLKSFRNYSNAFEIFWRIIAGKHLAWIIYKRIQPFQGSPPNPPAKVEHGFLGVTLFRSELNEGFRKCKRAYSKQKSDQVGRLALWGNLNDAVGLEFSVARWLSRFAKGTSHGILG